MDAAIPNERYAVIHLLQSGMTIEDIANELDHSVSWVYKCQALFIAGGWKGLEVASRAPHHSPTQLQNRIRQAIRETRRQLETEAPQLGELCYIGAYAIQARLRQRQLKPLPSISSIERELRSDGLVHPQPRTAAIAIPYPHLQPTQPHQVTQVDIYPHYLAGGQEVACFNAIDVVSHYATGQPYATRRSEEAQAFLLYAWAVLGLPTYTQLDNEGCFSGGATHPYVLGRVLRLGLFVGTELVYIPFYHPESNGTIERFHQDYAANTWAKIDFADVRAVRRYSPRFFRAYAHSTHQSALAGHSPLALHQASAGRPLPVSFELPPALPLTTGKVHFMREVSPRHTVRILNVEWTVPHAQPHQGVWATLEFCGQGATLRIYDAAPDAARQDCLMVHPFPLKEPVCALQSQFR